MANTYVRQGDPSILVVAPDERRTRIVEALAERGTAAVRAAETMADARSAIDEDIACVVTTCPNGDDPSLAERLAEELPDRPLVVVASEVDETTLARIAELGGTALPSSRLDRLAAIVDERVASFLERKRARDRFDAIEQLYETIDDTLFVKDDEARHVYLSENPEIPDPESALGMTDRTLHDSRFDIGQRWYEADVEVLETGEPIVERTEEYTDDDGNSFYQEVSVVPWRGDDGESKGVVGRRHEITDEIEQQQELERKNRRLDQFVDYITHDLQNPLQVAHGYLELAKNGEEGALEQVGTALGRMENLIDDVETLARGERKETMTVRSVEFVDFVEEVWGMIDSGDATLTIDAHPDARINAEQAEFRPMIENLLKNALDHAPADVSITVGTLNDGFYVEDDGVGVPEERRDEIFEKGYTTAANGAGTGLAIVSDVAETHNWELDVAEGSDGGARFRVRNCLLPNDPTHDPASGEALELSDSVDVGDPKVPGASTYDEATGTWSLSSAGADIYGHENQFRYVYTMVDGPVRISGHVTDLAPVHGFSKAGLMIRGSLDEDAVHGYVGRTVDRGTEVLWRTEPDTPTVSQHLTEAHEDYEWFRIDRDGDLVTCWVSHDGREWDPIDQRRVAYDEPVCVGIAACSVVPRNRTTGTFENVEIRRLHTE